MKRFILMLGIFSSFVLAGPLNTVQVSALFESSKGEACEALKTSTDDPCAADSGGRLNSVIGTALNILSLVVGIISVIMIVVGGLKFITSGGDSAQVASARGTIIFAAVGLIIVAFAQFIVRFVLQQVSK